jgi:hypothetical protein
LFPWHKSIGPDGSFNFSSCFTHNYREFLGGFSDWIEQVADARDALDYRRRIKSGPGQPSSTRPTTPASSSTMPAAREQAETFRRRHR